MLNVPNAGQELKREIVKLRAGVEGANNTFVQGVLQSQ
jgi:hypothetical protein